MAEFAQTTINKINQFYSRWAPRVPSEVTPRNVLIFCVVALLCLGSIMVASASMPYAERLHENSFHYVLHKFFEFASIETLRAMRSVEFLPRWFCYK